MRQAVHQVPNVRRGALYTALAATFGYFAQRQESLEIAPVVVDVFLPLLFLSALGLFIYGLLQR